jgi:hypothetical protein
VGGERDLRNRVTGRILASGVECPWRAGRAGREVVAGVPDPGGSLGRSGNGSWACCFRSFRHPPRESHSVDDLTSPHLCPQKVACRWSHLLTSHMPSKVGQPPPNFFRHASKLVILLPCDRPPTETGGRSTLENFTKMPSTQNPIAHSSDHLTTGSSRRR